MQSKILSKIKQHNFTKELKNFEYETKFNVRNEKSGALEILKKIRGCFKNSANYAFCEIKGGDKLITHVSFFDDKNTELSLFEYRFARMIKVKKHKVMKGGDLNVFKNKEELLVDKNDFHKNLKDLRHRFKRHNFRLIDINSYLKNKKGLVYAGEMTKTRVKDFVLDIREGRIYSVAVTFCKIKNKTQKQLEVEYSGYLRKLNKKGAERQIISGVRKLSEYIYKCKPTALKPTTERKYEFVKRISARI